MWYMMSPWVGRGGGGRWLIYWLILGVKCPVTRQGHMQAMLRPPAHKWKSSLLFTLHTPLCVWRWWLEKMKLKAPEIRKKPERIRMARFLAVGRACKAILWPVPGCEEGAFHSSRLPEAGTKFLYLWFEGGKRNRSAIFQTILCHHSLTPADSDNFKNAGHYCCSYFNVVIISIVSKETPLLQHPPETKHNCVDSKEGWFLVKSLFTWIYEGKGLDTHTHRENALLSWRVIFHQGGLWIGVPL